MDIDLWMRCGVCLSPTVNAWILIVFRRCSPEPASSLGSLQEERRAQLPRYVRLMPRPGQAGMAAAPAGAVPGMMHPQQGMPPQQPGMRHPMHGKGMSTTSLLELKMA